MRPAAPKAFPRDRALHTGYRQGGRNNSRRTKKRLQAELKQLALDERLAPSRDLFGEWVKTVTDNAAMVREAQRAEVLAAMDAENQAEAGAPLPRPLEPGDVFRLTGTFLRSVYGVDRWGACGAPDERWTAVSCECGLCESGRFVAIDTGRHFARANVERCPLAVSLRASEAEPEAFLASERDQIGVDRVAGTVRPWR